MADKDKGGKSVTPASGRTGPARSGPGGSSVVGRQTGPAVGGQHRSPPAEEEAADVDRDDGQEQDEHDGADRPDRGRELRERGPEAHQQQQQDFRGQIPAMVRVLHSASIPPELWIMLGQMLYDIVMRFLDRRNDP